MPLVKKSHHAKAAWVWCDTVDVANISEDNIRTSYRLHFPKCKPSACRRNCKWNPFCLSSLGETKWLSQTVEESDEDDTLELRKPNTFVGLKNLGATCYVNSLLQLWFHNPEFREAMFLWNPLEDPAENLLSVTNSGETSDIKNSRSVVGHLQLLFVLLQFGKQRTLDPKDFIQALDLEPSIQQDAQEFSNLFITLFEETLSHQSNPKVKNFISDNFQGEYSYITRCSKCLKESDRHSLFYELELNVKGNKSLQESLREFLKEEKMEGDNMYSCSECKMKQEATRFIRLDKLPPVLNFQLKRFLYDRQRAQKKKLNSFIQFPDSLDMSDYVSEDHTGPVLYNLSAVLIHRGPSAYSGHYIAHIRDRESGMWYKFNDEAVEKMEGDKLKLNAGEEDEDATRKPKQPRLAKGHLSSSNAYMLVYTQASSQGNIKVFTEDELPDHLKADLKKHNEEYETMISQSKEQRALIKVNGKVQREEIATLWKVLPVIEDNEDWEAISTSWLSHWLANAKDVVKPIDNSKLLCLHGKLHPDHSKEAKYINSYAGESLYEKYKGGPRLKGQDALCRECVTSKVKEIQMRNKIADDAKEITNLLKQPLNEGDPAFWVGKHSLKAWRKKAAGMYLTKEDEKHGTNGNEGDESDNDAQGNGQYIKNASDKKEEESAEEDGTRADGSLSPHENKNSRNGNVTDDGNNSSGKCGLKRKREVTENGEVPDEGKGEDEAEDGLEEDFNEEIVCPHGCLSMQESSRRLVSKLIWTKLKHYFTACKEFPRDAEPCTTCQFLASEGEVTMFKYKQQAQSQRELLSSLISNRGRPKLISGTYHVVSVPEFLNPWRKFIKENGRMEPLFSLRSSTLICVHGFLTINPNIEEDSDKLAPVTDVEWSILSSLYSADPEITCTYGPLGEIICTSPGFCDECLAARMESEHLALLQYDKATVYVRQVTNPKVPSTLTPDETDPPSPEMKYKSLGFGDAENIRRSTRHRRVRGEKQITIASTDTLRDLKFKILQILGVLPSDQHLAREDGTELTTLDATLASLNILPNSILILKVDEPVDDELAVPVDRQRTTEVEEGFKGTLLLKR
uniref:Ubiquitin carboxyl-terminal hydrolase 48 n=2 Tax=Lygus hesperus TaxID=30085 RepID=A0A146KSM3_LYGHE